MTIPAIGSLISSATSGSSSQDLQAEEQIGEGMALGMFQQMLQDAQKWQQVAKDNGLMDDFDSV